MGIDESYFAARAGGQKKNAAFRGEGKRRCGNGAELSRAITAVAELEAADDAIEVTGEG